MEILLIIMGCCLVVSLYINHNMLRKNEKLEQLVIDQSTMINVFDEAIEYSNLKLKELDRKGTFKSDDEIGWFFKNILYIQELLNSFKTNIYEESKNTQKINQEKQGNQSENNQEDQNNQSKDYLSGTYIQTRNTGGTTNFDPTRSDPRSNSTTGQGTTY